MAAISNVWLHFTKKTSEGKAQCIHCPTKYAYKKGGTTTPLRRHLEAKHASVLHGLRVKVESKQEDAHQPHISPPPPVKQEFKPVLTAPVPPTGSQNTITVCFFHFLSTHLFCRTCRLSLDHHLFLH